MQFAQYAAVKVKALRKEMAFVPDAMNRRLPKVGDIATIIEVYTKPDGYELECSGLDGVTEWLLAFSPEDIELDSIK